MRLIALVAYGVVLLIIQGAIFRILHLDFFRPDPILILVVFLALRGSEGALVSCFILGFIAEAFAGSTTGMLTIIYLVVWMVIRTALVFLLSERHLLQYGFVFFMSLLAHLAQLAIWATMPSGNWPLGTLGIWMVPLAIVNLMLAGPIWIGARRILRTQQRSFIPIR